MLAALLLAAVRADGGDPTFVEEAYIKASNTGRLDIFGTAVAVSGNTLVVGAPGEQSGAGGINGDEADDSAGASGAVYVFVREGGLWSQQAYLKASNPGRGDRFGSALALSGDTLVVGAFWEDGGAAGVDGDGSDDSVTNSGTAYVFERSGSDWSQQAYLKSNAPGEGDRFGWSVAISGDRVVVGSPDEDEASGGAHMFVRDGAVWRSEAHLKAGNAEAGDLFGSAVALSGDTLVVSAAGEDSAATGVAGDGSDNRIADSGAAYIFVRGDEGWNGQAYLKASNPGELDSFGISVSLSGDTLVVGAANEDSAATGVDGMQNDNSASAAGAAYVFRRTGMGWGQEAYLKASNAGSSDGFGGSVSVSGERIVVGAPGEASRFSGIDGPGTDNSGRDVGAAYAFLRSQGSWSQQGYLKPSNPGDGVRFGKSVSVSAEFVVVGAPLEDSDGVGIDPGQEPEFSTADSGAAYLFSRCPPALSPISMMTPTADGWRLSIRRSRGRQIGVEYSPDLAAGSWVDLGNFFGSGNLLAFTDADAVRAGREVGYYRAFLRPETP